MALWRSGDAADCKSVYAGSIPAGASRPSRQSDMRGITLFSREPSPFQLPHEKIDAK